MKDWDFDPEFGGEHAVGWGDAISLEEAKFLLMLEKANAITIHDESLRRYLKGLRDHEEQG